MTESDLTTITEAYMAAFERKDAEACMPYFADGAIISWPARTYVGQADIKQWHVERFEANMRFVQVKKIRVEGNTVVVDLVAASDRLKLMGINRLGARVTITFNPERKVERVKFGVRFQR